jgi:chloride channel 7
MPPSYLPSYRIPQQQPQPQPRPQLPPLAPSHVGRSHAPLPLHVKQQRDNINTAGASPAAVAGAPVSLGNPKNSLYNDPYSSTASPYTGYEPPLKPAFLNYSSLPLGSSSSANAAAGAGAGPDAAGVGEGAVPLPPGVSPHYHNTPQQQMVFATIQREVGRQFSKPLSAHPLTLDEYKALLRSKNNALDCAPVRNVLTYKASVAATSADARLRGLCVWVLTAVIALILGIYGFTMVYAMRETNDSKFGHVGGLLAGGHIASAWAVYTGWNCALLMLCAIILNFQPSGASGIPDVKAYLNGANVPGSFTLLGLIVKVVCTYLCIGASMPIGTQGPLTHTGALIGGWMAHHWLAVTRRLCCCAGVRDEVRDPEDRLAYPSHHPGPASASTLAPVAAAGATAAAESAAVALSGAARRPDFWALPPSPSVGTRAAARSRTGSAAESTGAGVEGVCACSAAAAGGICPCAPSPVLQPAAPGSRAMGPRPSANRGRGSASGSRSVTRSRSGSSGGGDSETETDESDPDAAAAAAAGDEAAIGGIQLTRRRRRLRRRRGGASPLGRTMSLSQMLDLDRVNQDMQAAALEGGDVHKHLDNGTGMKWGIASADAAQALKDAGSGSDTDVDANADVDDGAGHGAGESAGADPQQPQRRARSCRSTDASADTATAAAAAEAADADAAAADVSAGADACGSRGSSSRLRVPLSAAATNAAAAAGAAAPGVGTPLEFSLLGRPSDAPPALARGDSFSHSEEDEDADGVGRGIAAGRVPLAVAVSYSDSRLAVTQSPSLGSSAAAGVAGATPLLPPLPPAGAGAFGGRARASSGADNSDTGSPALPPLAGYPADYLPVSLPFGAQGRMNSWFGPQQQLPPQTPSLAARASRRPQSQNPADLLMRGPTVSAAAAGGPVGGWSQSRRDLISGAGPSSTAGLADARPRGGGRAGTLAPGASFRASARAAEAATAPHKGCGPRALRRLQAPSFSDDNDRREFMLLGSACGISASMAVPLGGTLFVADEISTFWTIRLGLLSLFGCTLAALTAAFFSTGAAGNWGNFIKRASSSYYVGSRISEYRMYEVIAYIILGCCAGAAGALFANLYDRLARFRSRVTLNRPVLKVTDTVVIAALWSTVNFFIPMLWNCQLVSPEFAELDAAAFASAGTFRVNQFDCPPGYHNTMADLTFVRQDLILKHLFVRDVPNWFSMGQLAAFFSVYAIAAMGISVTSVVAGLFVRDMTLGGIMGRFFALVVSQIVSATEVSHINPGAYAAVGAASFLVGTTGNALCTTVLLAEIMSDFSYFVPIVIGCIAAHATGRVISDPAYVLAAITRRMPVLPRDPPRQLQTMQAKHLMTRSPVCLGLNEPVSHVLEVLASCTHNGFPVIYSTCAANKQPQPSCPSATAGTAAAVAEHASRHQGFGANTAVAGLVLRKHLMILLLRRVWRPQAREFTPAEFAMACNWPMPRMRDVTAGLSRRDLAARLDLGPYLNRTPLTVHGHYAADVTFRLFTSMHLRHLPVVDERSALVGIITRLELLTPVVQHRYAAQLLRERRDVRAGGLTMLQRHCHNNTAFGLRKAFYTGIEDTPEGPFALTHAAPAASAGPGAGATGRAAGLQAGVGAGRGEGDTHPSKGPESAESKGRVALRLPSIAAADAASGGASAATGAGAGPAAAAAANSSRQLLREQHVRRQLLRQQELQLQLQQLQQQQLKQMQEQQRRRQSQLHLQQQRQQAQSLEALDYYTAVAAAGGHAGHGARDGGGSGSGSAAPAATDTSPASPAADELFASRIEDAVADAADVIEAAYLSTPSAVRRRLPGAAEAAGIAASASFSGSGGASGSAAGLGTNLSRRNSRRSSRQASRASSGSRGRRLGDSDDDDDSHTRAAEAAARAAADELDSAGAGATFGDDGAAAVAATADAYDGDEDDDSSGSSSDGDSSDYGMHLRAASNLSRHHSGLSGRSERSHGHRHGHHNQAQQQQQQPQQQHQQDAHSRRGGQPGASRYADTHRQP